MLTADDVEALVARCDAFYLSDAERAFMVAAMREHAKVEAGPVDFRRLDDGAWRAGAFIRRRVPQGVADAHAAILAHEQGMLPPTLPEGRSAHAVRTGIRDTAVEWAASRCPELVPVLKAVTVSERDGTIVFDPPASGLPALKLQN